MKLKDAKPDPKLLRCTAWMIVGRKRVAVLCQKHGTRITSARLRRGFNLQRWWQSVKSLWEKRACKGEAKTPPLWKRGAG